MGNFHVTNGTCSEEVGAENVSPQPASWRHTKQSESLDCGLGESSQRWTVGETTGLIFENNDRHCYIFDISTSKSHNCKISETSMLCQQNLVLNILLPN